jgi:hypothetical protein
MQDEIKLKANKLAIFRISPMFYVTFPLSVNDWLKHSMWIISISSLNIHTVTAVLAGG